MTEEDMTFAEPLAGEELERTLARYARLRLEPSQAQARRARAAVMEAAWRQRLDPQPTLVASASPAIAARHGRLPFSGWGARRVGASFAAAVLAGLMLGTSVFAGSRAGGPLYESRIALESLTLPADPAARVAAQVAHADARLGEAVEAAFRHDDRATAAALGAYDRTIADLGTAEGPEGAKALEAVKQHRGVLLQLATQVSDDAVTGIQTALANSGRVIDKLTAGAEGGGSEPSGPNGAGGVNGGPQGGGNGAGGVNGEPQGGGNGAGGVNGEPQGGGPGANNGNANGAGNGNGAGAGAGSGAGNGSGNGAGNGAGSGNGGKPVATATPKPAATSTPAPHKTPKPRKTPPAHGQEPTEAPQP